jgi:hypothetical protein
METTGTKQKNALKNEITIQVWKWHFLGVVKFRRCMGMCDTFFYCSTVDPSDSDARILI